jgi:transposase
VVDPLLPKVERRPRHPGRKRHPGRLVFQGILFVLHTGVAWEHSTSRRNSASVRV